LSVGFSSNRILFSIDGPTMKMSFQEHIEKPALGFEQTVQEGTRSAISGINEDVDFRRLCHVGSSRHICFRIPAETEKPCKLVI
jgi:hypothetical protein